MSDPIRHPSLPAAERRKKRPTEYIESGRFQSIRVFALESSGVRGATMTQSATTPGSFAEIREEPICHEHLVKHASISIVFKVERLLDVVVQKGGLGGFKLIERAIAAPYVKDYDALPANGPAGWAMLFDLSNWGLLSAWWDGRRVGGAVIAFNTEGVQMLEGRRDLAMLWDLRVAPEMRRSGIGSALFAATEQWAKTRGCRQLNVETQNINVAACNFYASHGCQLGAIDRFAYPELPNEVQLLWYKNLPCDGVA